MRTWSSRPKLRPSTSRADLQLPQRSMNQPRCMKLPRDVPAATGPRLVQQVETQSQTENRGLLDETVKQLQATASEAETRAQQAEARLLEAEARQVRANTAVKQATARIDELERALEAAQQSERALAARLRDAEIAWEQERAILQADVVRARAEAEQSLAAHEKERHEWIAQNARLTSRVDASEQWWLYELQQPAAELSALLGDCTRPRWPPTTQNPHWKILTRRLSTAKRAHRRRRADSSTDEAIPHTSPARGLNSIALQRI